MKMLDGVSEAADTEAKMIIIASKLQEEQIKLWVKQGGVVLRLFNGLFPTLQDPNFGKRTEGKLSGRKDRRKVFELYAMEHDDASHCSRMLETWSKVGAMKDIAVSLKDAYLKLFLNQDTTPFTFSGLLMTRYT